MWPEQTGGLLAIKGIDAFPSPPHTYRAVDGDPKTRWSGGAQHQSAEFTIELVQPAHVGQVVTDLAEFWTDYPQRLRLEVSADGGRWDTVFFGDTALQAYFAAVRHPKAVPLVFPVDRDNIRFIRLRQTGWGDHDWSIAEVRVLR